MGGHAFFDAGGGIGGWRAELMNWGGVRWGGVEKLGGREGEI